MRRLLPALLAAALLAPPSLAFAHDPLDDVSGEEDLNQKREEEKTSAKKEHQEAELAKEVQERDDTEFHLNQEKEEFLRDRAETKDVIAGQKRRNELGGAAGRAHHAAPAPQPEPSGKSDDAAPDPRATPAPVETKRGDVDPTEVDAKPVEEGGGSPMAPDHKGKGKKKKKH